MARASRIHAQSREEYAIGGHALTAQPPCARPALRGHVTWHSSDGLHGTVRARGAGRSALGDVSSREVVEAHLEGFLVWRRGAGLPHHNI